MKVVARAGWDARDPKNRATVPWSVRTEFFVHHTDGPTTQTIRSIQDFHMDGRGWSDIGYNFLVRDDGTIYEGRGWTVVGAHCPNHNRTGVSASYIGKNAPTEAAKRSIRWLYDEACRKAGRSLKKLGHGDRYPTECPGKQLQAWVDAGMPAESAQPEPAISWTESTVKELPTLGLDDDGFDVKTVRGCLFARGRVPASAYNSDDAGLKAWLENMLFDPALVELVTVFQRAEGLKPDGICGQATWPRLLRVG